MGQGLPEFVARVPFEPVPVLGLGAGIGALEKVVTGIGSAEQKKNQEVLDTQTKMQISSQVGDHFRQLSKQIGESPQSPNSVRLYDAQALAWADPYVASVDPRYRSYASNVTVHHYTNQRNVVIGRAHQALVAQANIAFDQNYNGMLQNAVSQVKNGHILPAHFSLGQITSAIDAKVNQGEMTGKKGANLIENAHKIVYTAGANKVADDASRIPDDGKSLNRVVNQFRNNPTSKRLFPPKELDAQALIMQTAGKRANQQRGVSALATKKLEQNLVEITAKGFTPDPEAEASVNEGLGIDAGGFQRDLGIARKTAADTSSVKFASIPARNEKLAELTKENLSPKDADAATVESKAGNNAAIGMIKAGIDSYIKDPVATDITNPHYQQWLQGEKNAIVTTPQIVNPELNRKQMQTLSRAVHARLINTQQTNGIDPKKIKAVTNDQAASDNAQLQAKPMSDQLQILAEKKLALGKAFKPYLRQLGQIGYPINNQMIVAMGANPASRAAVPDAIASMSMTPQEEKLLLDNTDKGNTFPNKIDNKLQTLSQPWSDSLSTQPGLPASAEANILKPVKKLAVYYATQKGMSVDAATTKAWQVSVENNYTQISAPFGNHGAVIRYPLNHSVSQINSAVNAMIRFANEHPRQTDVPTFFGTQFGALSFAARADVFRKTIGSQIRIVTKPDDSGLMGIDENGIEVRFQGIPLETPFPALNDPSSRINKQIRSIDRNKFFDLKVASFALDSVDDAAELNKIHNLLDSEKTSDRQRELLQKIGVKTTDITQIKRIISLEP